MSLVSPDLNPWLVQTIAPGPITGLSTTAPLDPFELGSPVPQAIFTTDASTRAWNNHLKKLGPKEREFFLKYAAGNVESFSSLVQRICTKRQEQSWISKINGLLRPFCKTLGMYMPVASAASQADPYPSSIVVGGIIGLLQISENFDSYQQLIIKWLSKLSAKATLLMEFDICIYQYDERIQEALVLIYGDILDFSQKALKLSLIERFSDTFGEIVDNLDKHLDSYKAYAKLCDPRRLMQTYWMVVNSTLQQRQSHQEIMDSLTAGQIEMQARQLQAYQAQISASQELRDVQRQAREDIIDSLLAGRSEIQAQEDQRAAERKRSSEKEEQARRESKKMLVMNWLPSVQFQYIHDERSAAVAAGTGTWFHSHGLYQSWKTSAHSDLLWVTGKPGCGKSILAALTWNDLKPFQSDHTAVARFYCDLSNPERSSYSYLLTTLLKQVSGQSQRLHHDLEQMYNNEGLIQDRGPGVNEVEKLLPTIISGFSQAFIIIDGLDELREPNAFLKVLPVLLRETTSELRVIVFCRDYLLDSLPSLNTLKNYPHLHVDQGANKDDIAIFISSKLSTDDPDWDTDLLEVVKTVLLDRADGIFLYVSLMVGRLRGSLSQNELIDRLKSLPKGLTKAYEANLKRILNQEEDLDRTMTLKILLWIANAKRPLSRKELLEALSIRQGANKKDRGGTDRDFVTFCAELIYFDNNDFYHLVHTSLRDYLLEVRSDASVELGNYQELQLHAERTLAEACLTYLLFEEFSAGPVHTAEDLAQMLRENPFLRYAAEHWGSHVASAAEDAPANLVREFIENENARNLCIQVIMAEDDIYPFPGSSSPLHILAYFGLSTFANSRSDLRVLKHQIDGYGMLPIDYAMMEGKRAMCLWLLERDENSDSEAGPVMARYSAYHVAVTFEWNDVLERLISNGYDVDFRTSNKRRTPLAEAAAQGNEKAVNRFLEAKADVNAKDAEGKNPLMIALVQSHLNLVLPLLRNGTDLDAQDDDGVSALHLAVEIGNLDIFKTLLERKPRLQVTSEKYWNQTPLHLAAEHDYEEIFRELHGYGAELDFTCIGGFRPIHLAAFHNSLKVARLLADLKAEINPQSEEGTTVLHVAAGYSSVEFVELILTINPELNAKEGDEDEDTALHVAARAGVTAVCKLLLDRGVAVDLLNAKKHTALHLAVSEGHTETAKLLLDHNANPMKTAVFDSPVLHYAANEGNSEILQPLLDARADPEAVNSHGHRALHFAARKGHKEFVEKLFTAVAHLNADSQDLDGKTALHLAAAAGHLSTVQVLEERGAQSNIQNFSQDLPLHYAAWGGHLRVVEMLTSEANVNAQGYRGRTMLNIGAIRGHKDIFHLLLNRNAKLELAADDGSTPLMNAVRNNHSEIAHLLINRGANIHTIDDEHRTLLHEAAHNGDYDLAKVLIDRQCDVHAVSNFGDTPFLDAVYSNNLKIVELISSLEVDGYRHQNKLGLTPIHVAAEEGNLQMVDKLLDAGATLDSIDRIGRTALSMAANEGRHALVELLLSQGLNVNGHDDCFCTPLSVVCDNGHVRFAEILLRHDADIHKRTKHNNMTPLHHAAAMHRPQIIRKLVGLGADTLSRDCYANSALDYASTHAASSQAIKDEEMPYVSLNLANRRAILWRNIRHELESLLSLSQPVTAESELARCLKLKVLANSFLYLRDTEQYQTIIYLFMELFFSVESAVLQLTFRCDICSIILNHNDFCICRDCHSVHLCTRCHGDYKEGWKAPKSAPEGIRELEQLEKQIEPLRKVMLSVICEVKVNFIPLIISFFTVVQIWVDTKHKEYDDWETKFNVDDLYRFKKRPCQQLLKLLGEGRVFMKSLKERGLQFDEQREDCAALVKTFSDYYRTHNVLKDDVGFHCSGHEYLKVSKKEYDQACLDRRVFYSNRRLADRWFRELLAKCPSVDKLGETGAKPDENLREMDLNSKAEPQEPTERAVSNKDFHDGVHAVGTPSARLQETSGENALLKDEDAPEKSHVATKKPIEAPASSRPKMPQGLRSSLTSVVIPRTVSAVEEHSPVVNDNAAIEELRSPTIAATAFLNLESVEDGAPMGQISNIRRFTAELLERHRNLKRRITSPILDTEDPFDDSSLRRRATTPSSNVLESQEWTESHQFKDAQRSRNAEAPAADSPASPYRVPSMAQNPDALPLEENAADAPNDESTVTISGTNNYGRFVTRALEVAQSIFPDFVEKFLIIRAERGDLTDYSLEFELVEASP